MVVGAASANRLLQSPLNSEPAQRVNVAGVSARTSPEQPQPQRGEAIAKSSAQSGQAVPSRQTSQDVAQEAEMAAVIAQLRARDQEVRAHEMAHLAAAGGYATSGASYTYQTGPDGRKYAVGGEVGIDVSPERDPEATVRKMQVIQQAALAPADPSAQDMRVAATAAQAMMQALQELRQQNGAQNTQQMNGEDGVRTEQSDISTNASQMEGVSRSKPQEMGGDLLGVLQMEQQRWQQRLRIQAANVSRA